MTAFGHHCASSARIPSPPPVGGSSTRSVCASLACRGNTSGRELVFEGRALRKDARSAAGAWLSAARSAWRHLPPGRLGRRALHAQRPRWWPKRSERLRRGLSPVSRPPARGGPRRRTDTRLCAAHSLPVSDYSSPFRRGRSWTGARVWALPTCHTPRRPRGRSPTPTVPAPVGHGGGITTSSTPASTAASAARGQLPHSSVPPGRGAGAAPESLLASRTRRPPRT